MRGITKRGESCCCRRLFACISRGGGKRRARDVRVKLGVKEPTNERRISSLRPPIGELLKGEGGAYRSEEEEDEHKQAEQVVDAYRFEEDEEKCWK